MNRGYLAFKAGIVYEQVVANICKNYCKVSSIAGNSNKNDLILYIQDKEVPIEIKKCRSIDFMQMSITYKDSIWQNKSSAKISDGSINIFNKIIKDIDIFSNKMPKFMYKKITHEEWIKIKYPDFKDQYIPCNSDVISQLYAAKGCYYIQLSTYGLYHLGNDILNLGVPYFTCEQELRVRTKVHSKNKRGFCHLSCMISAKPKNIKYLKKSNYSLDDHTRFPTKVSEIN